MYECEGALSRADNCCRVVGYEARGGNPALEVIPVSDHTIS